MHRTTPGTTENSEGESRLLPRSSESDRLMVCVPRVRTSTVPPAWDSWLPLAVHSEPLPSWQALLSCPLSYLKVHLLRERSLATCTTEQPRSTFQGRTEIQTL